MKIVPVVLCGGSGSRLWPVSRSAHPKQLLPLVGEQSLLATTLRRPDRLSLQTLAPVLLCNEAQRFLVAAQCEAAGHAPGLMILEPEGRNTAPAVTLAALAAEAEGSADDLLLVMPADHAIADVAAWAAAVEKGMAAAAQGALITFGIRPDAPETGYGYLRASPEAGDVKRVAEFVEKPDLATARRYVASGDYLWNSGMFLFSAASWLQSMSEHAGDILASCRAAFAGGSRDGGTLHPAADDFLACRAESVDYAVMEKTSRARVVPMAAGWSDVGSWSALHDISEHDSRGNTLRGDAVALDCRNSYLRSDSRLVTAIGLEGCIVVETKDALLVAPRDRAQDVKTLVDRLAGQGREEVKLGREVFRPWGSYDSLDAADGYQVKRLTVLPGAVLSLQLHHHRAEHWVVVAGRARITRDDEVFDLEKNEHCFIPLGAHHRIENPGEGLLHIIEVQVGDYLGEDDIVRFEDRYGREGRTD